MMKEARTKKILTLENAIEIEKAVTKVAMVLDLDFN